MDIIILHLLCLLTHLGFFLTLSCTVFSLWLCFYFPDICWINKTFLLFLVVVLVVKVAVLESNFVFIFVFSNTGLNTTAYNPSLFAKIGVSVCIYLHFPKYMVPYSWLCAPPTQHPAGALYTLPVSFPVCTIATGNFRCSSLKTKSIFFFYY